MLYAKNAGIFVSSTFRDMMAERDALNREVLPLLRQRLSGRGVDPVLIDLRWGITGDESGRGLTVRLCLDAIDAARPLFLGMIGDRYGWVPDEWSGEDLERYPWIDPVEGKSVTEREMEYGAFLREANAAFLIKSDPIPGPETKKRNALAERVKNSGYPYAVYTDIGDFAEKAAELLTGMLESAFPEEEARDERDLPHEWAYAASLNGYIPLPGNTGAREEVLNGSHPVTVITGEPGCGKTAFLCDCIRELSGGARVIAHFCAAQPGKSAEDVMRRLLRLMGEDTAVTPEELPAHFRRTLSHQREKLVIAIDAIDVLGSDNTGMSFLPRELPDSVRIVMSCAEGEALEALEAMGAHRVTLKGLQKEDISPVAREYLGRYAKKTDAGQTRLLQECEACRAPAFLKIVLDELRRWGSFEGLEDQLKKYLACRDRNELFQRVLERLTRDYAEADRVLPLLALVPYGLPEGDIADVCGVTRAAWMRLRIALADELVLGGRVRLMDGVFAEACRLYFADRESRSIDRLISFYRTRSAGEKALVLPYPLLRAGRTEELGQLLRDPEMLLSLDELSRSALMKLMAVAGGALEADYAARAGEIVKKTPAGAMIAALTFTQMGSAEAPGRIFPLLIDAYTDRKDDVSLQYALGYFARHLMRLGSFDEAEALLERKAAIARDLGMKKEEARAAGNIGIIEMNEGRWDEAEEDLLLARNVSCEVGYLTGEETAVGHLADIRRWQNDMPGAEALYREQERLCRLGMEPVGRIAALCGLGYVYLGGERIKEAADSFSAAEELCLVYAQYDAFTQVSIGLALVNMREGDPAAAQERLERESERCRLAGDHYGQSLALANLAQCFWAAGDAAGAYETAKSREEVLREAGDMEQMPECYLDMARYAHGTGDTEGFEQALQMARSLAQVLGRDDLTDEIDEINETGGDRS